eukprot:gnl/Chilomastix_cuspidata/1197.p1 GENE.gnl/Chilomastix_cuspidata/1197~~gnl/Chilomastix_cuspidata/1197.p1  ORF type:complete len:280 (-),score=71.18 gnl/Chilomastix_cuspidata/1197:189-998(-)
MDLQHAVADLPPETLKQLDDAIPTRFSCRRFSGEPLSEEKFEMLTNFAASLPFPDGVKFHVVRCDTSTIFKSFLGLMKTKGASTIGFMTVAPGTPNRNEYIGILGELIILFAHSIGVGTCWNGGMFNEARLREQCRVPDAEGAVVFTTPFGIPVSVPDKPRKRKPLSNFIAAPELPPAILNIINAAIRSPTAINRQPFRFEYEPDTGLRLFVTKKGVGSKIVAFRWDAAIAASHVLLRLRALGGDPLATRIPGEPHDLVLEVPAVALPH